MTGLLTPFLKIIACIIGIAQLFNRLLQEIKFSAE